MTRSLHARVTRVTRTCHGFSFGAFLIMRKGEDISLTDSKMKRKMKKSGFFEKKNVKCIVSSKKSNTFASQLTKRPFRAFSSAGSEHLPYKQRVGGSNPSTPTPIKISFSIRFRGV